VEGTAEKATARTYHVEPQRAEVNVIGADNPQGSGMDILTNRSCRAPRSSGP